MGEAKSPAPSLRRLHFAYTRLSSWSQNAISIPMRHGIAIQSTLLEKAILNVGDEFAKMDIGLQGGR